MQYYSPDTVLYLDGEFINATEATTDLYAQSLHYGYAVFEGIRAYATPDGTQIFRAREHYDRLRFSAESMKIPYVWDTEALIEATHTLLQKNGMQDAYIRPLVFCPPNMSLYKATKASLMICAWSWGAYLGSAALRLKISPFCRPHPRSTVIEAKASGHYVNSILATTDAKDSGYDEALLLDVDGYVAEGPGANLFFEKAGVLYTPRTGNILPGITRATVIQLTKDLGVDVAEGKYSAAQLKDSDAGFYCGTAAEVAPIASVDDYAFPLPWKKSIGYKLQRAYKALVTGEKVKNQESRVKSQESAL